MTHNIIAVRLKPASRDSSTEQFAFYEMDNEGKVKDIYGYNDHDAKAMGMHTANTMNSGLPARVFRVSVYERHSSIVQCAKKALRHLYRNGVATITVLDGYTDAAKLAFDF